jgi:hypothetical protein
MPTDARLNKIFTNDDAGAGHFSPPKCIGKIEQVIQWDRGRALINTSFAADGANEHEVVHVVRERLQQEV